MEQAYSDPLLIQRIRDGENQAFKTVMEHLHARLAGMARQLLPAKEDAEDAVAHGFLRLFEHRHKIESISHIEGFLHDTVKHKCLELQEKGRRRKMLWDKRPAWMARSERSEQEADQRVLKAELTYCIQAELDKMPEHWRKAYQLHVVEKMTAGEVAALMGVSERTVRTYAQQAAGQIYASVISKGLHILLIFFVLKLLR